MKPIKAILIDDEEKALMSLQLKLQRFFPNIQIDKTFQNPKEGLVYINENQPDILFLDIEMPVLSGFDVLASIENPAFEIIFVTAYNNYAIQAFQHCAIGYILKPIDTDELKISINNALNSINQKEALLKNQALLSNIITTSSKINKLIIPTTKGMSFIPFDEILHIEGYNGYTKIHLSGKKEIVSSYNIGRYDKMLSDIFFKCHKSHIINLQKICAFENEGYIILENNKRVTIAKSKRKEFLDLLSM